MNHGNMVGFHSNVLIVLRDEKYVFVNAEKIEKKQVVQINKKLIRSTFLFKHLPTYFYKSSKKSTNEDNLL